MKAYWIARVNVNNKEAYSQYAKRVSSALKKYNGKFLVRGGKFSILEGKHEYERNVLIEFPSFEIAKEFYNSKEYQDAHDVLKGHAVRHHQTIEGH